MSGPPDDSDGVDEVLDQVERALDELRLEDEGARSALLDGVRSALGELGLGGAGDPRIHVVDGGRGVDDPTTEAPRPELRVAHQDDERSSSARVRVVRVGGVEATTHDGVIAVSQADVWQTVSRAAAARPYRVWCATGMLRVAIDGLPADTLAAGQSLDVEARLVRVCSADGTAATGRYVRLRGAE